MSRKNLLSISRQNYFDPSGPLALCWLSTSFTISRTYFTER